jgi:alpha-tubulin suppressor-like RCC1 family protein
MPTTNFKNSSGTDIGNTLVEKSYLIDRYPELADTFKQAGLWTMGRFYIGVDSNGDLIYDGRTSPVQAYGGKNNDWKLVATCTNYYTVNHTGIKTDGTLWVWGSNSDGSGNPTGTVDGTAVAKNTPVQIGANTWKEVSTGRFHWMAIRTDGTLWGQGKQTASFGLGAGQLGTGNNVTYDSPVQTISGGSNWKTIACGEWCSGAIKTDGTLWMWGWNNDGQLGLNLVAGNSDQPPYPNGHKSSPVQIYGGGTNWKQLALGGGHSAAIKTDGTLWGWGDNWAGQLGDGTTTVRSSPVQIAGTTWKVVSCGNRFTAAIKTDGTLWMWGYNGNGDLGDGTTTSRSSPVQTIAAGTNWKIIKSGMSSTMAIKTDGTLWGWGYNGSEYAPFGGQIGDGTRVDKSSPVQTIAGGTNWKTIAAGNRSTLAIRDDSADIFGNTL